MIRLRAYLLLLPMIPTTYAAETTCVHPDVSRLKHMCAMVGMRMKDNSGRNPYLFQTRFQEAACIPENATESREEQYAKIRGAWAANEDKMLCSGASFDLKDGNILKFAVSNKFDDFIFAAIKWRVNLNRIDTTDGQTLLDYIQYHRDQHQANPLGNTYQFYYNRFREAGAKHRKELPNSE